MAKSKVEDRYLSIISYRRQKFVPRMEPPQFIDNGEEKIACLAAVM